MSWKVEQYNEDKKYMRYTIMGETESFIHPEYGCKVGGNAKHIADIRAMPSKTETLANAILIANSPKLLTTLIKTVDCLEYAVNALQAPEKSSIRETLQDAKNLINQVKGN